MAVAIRLRRSGAKKRPFYRIVVAHSSDRLGYYSPIEPVQLEVNVDLAVSWLHRGAQPSETVRSLLAKTGAIAKWRGEDQPEAASEETVIENVASEETASE
jgi:small subunit ribosomal protein S16